MWDAVIVGAGPAGLVLAHALLERGYSVQVLERRDAFRPIGAAIFMHPFALNSLRSVSAHVEHALRQVSTPIRAISVSSMTKDNINFVVDRLDEATDTLGAPFVTVRFWDMLCALKQGLPNDIFRFGHDLQEFEQLEEGGVSVKYNVGMASNSTETKPGSLRARVLLDVGGIRSKTRLELVGDKPIPRLRALYAIASGQNVSVISRDADHSSSTNHGNRQLSFLLADAVSMTIASLDNGDIWWTDTRYADDPTRRSIPSTDDIGFQQQLEERFAIWPSHVQALVEATDSKDIIDCTIAELPVTWKWGQGYDVTLLGDAAHAQLPALGLGVSTAFADVDELCRQIDKFGLNRQALRWYEFVRIPQTAFLQLASRAAFFFNVYLGKIK